MPPHSQRKTGHVTSDSFETVADADVDGSTVTSGGEAEAGAARRPGPDFAGRADAVAALQQRIVDGLTALDGLGPDGAVVSASAVVDSRTVTQEKANSGAPGLGTPADGEAPNDGSEEAAGPSAAALSTDAATSDDNVVRALEHRESVRIVEALLFASPEPVDPQRLAASLKPGTDLAAVITELQSHYEGRGVSLVRVAGKWTFRTARDLGWLLERHAVEERRLSKAALETMAIIAYHQPVTRAEIEEIRGVATSKGTLDVLMETGWVRPRGRRRAPGKPITYGTTDAFLGHFSLDAIRDLPGLADLRGAGLLDSNLPPDFRVPDPTDVAALMPDELPLEDEDPGQGTLELDEPEDDEEGDSGAGDDAPVEAIDFGSSET